MLKNKKKTLDTSALEHELAKVNTELKQISRALEKLVYLGEFQLKSAGASINYPGRDA